MICFGRFLQDQIWNGFRLRYKNRHRIIVLEFLQEGGLSWWLHVSPGDWTQWSLGREGRRMESSTGREQACGDGWEEMQFNSKKYLWSHLKIHISRSSHVRAQEEMCSSPTRLQSTPGTAHFLALCVAQWPPAAGNSVGRWWQVGAHWTGKVGWWDRLSLDFSLKATFVSF